MPEFLLHSQSPLTDHIRALQPKTISGADLTTLRNSFHSYVDDNISIGAQHLKGLSENDHRIMAQFFADQAKPHLDAIQKHAIPQHMVDKIIEAKKKALAAMDDHSREFLNITKKKSNSKKAAINKANSEAEAATRKLRANTNDKAQEKLEKECNDKWSEVGKASKRDCSKLKESYNTYRDRYDEYAELHSMNPAKFAEEERRHSIRELNALDKKVSEAQANTESAYERLRKAPLKNDERAAFDTYLKNMRDDDTNIDDHTKKLREVFEPKGKKVSKNHGALMDTLRIENEYFGAKSDRERFVNGSKDLKNFLAERDNAIAEKDQKISDLWEDVSQHKYDIINLQSDKRNLERQSQDAESAKTTATEKTNEAKSMKTQRNWWIGGTIGATVLGLGAFAFLLHKQSQLANQPG